MTKACAQCSADLIIPDELSTASVFCNDECWQGYHDNNPSPGVWVPVEDTLPGGRYDGVWENSGLQLGETHDSDG